jgi:chemotaxis response regulator CheB
MAPHFASSCRANTTSAQHDWTRHCRDRHFRWRAQGFECAVLSEIPVGIGAAIFVVQHLAADKKSYLPKLLGDITDLPVSSPADDEPFQIGRVYVAVPDHHLLLNDGRVRVLRGPQENRFRPSIDALFRSAARSHGSASSEWC